MSEMKPSHYHVQSYQGPVFSCLSGKTTCAKWQFVTCYTHSGRL